MNRLVERNWNSKPRRRRLLLILGGMACVGIALALILNATRNNLVFFYSPSQIAEHEAPHNRTFRVGGLVQRGSLQHSSQDVMVRFVVTDTAHSIPVVYKGVLPDMFEQGKGVVAQGVLGADGVFHADQVLAKHDANYMPPNVAQELRAAQSRRVRLGAVSGGER